MDEESYYLVTRHSDQVGKWGWKNVKKKSTKLTVKRFATNKAILRSPSLHSNQLFQSKARKKDFSFLLSFRVNMVAKLCWPFNWNCMLLSNDSKLERFSYKLSRWVYMIIKKKRLNIKQSDNDNNNNNNSTMLLSKVLCVFFCFSSNRYKI